MPVECLPMPSLPDAQHGRSCSSQSGHMEARSSRDSFKGRRRGSEADVDKPAYKTDAFRMMVMKVAPCSKKFCHDWTACPFAHPGEKARRRNPRTHDYSGVACPDMKKDSQCPRGDRCPYAHNVFEYWLHPTRYRTQMCNDGERCSRNVCFFAHNLDELRMPTIRPFVTLPLDPLPAQPHLQQPVPHEPQPVMQGDADSLAAQLAWMRLQHQGSDPFGFLPQPQNAALLPGPVPRGSAHDSVKSMGYHAGHQAQGTLSAEDWQSMGKFRARSDPGHPQNRGLSYEAGQLYHSPWSVDAILRSALPGYPENQTSLPEPVSSYMHAEAHTGAQHQLQQAQAEAQHQQQYQQQQQQQQGRQTPQQELSQQQQEDQAQQHRPQGQAGQNPLQQRQQSPLSHAAFASPSQAPHMSPQPHSERAPFLFAPEPRQPLSEAGASESHQGSGPYGQLWQLAHGQSQAPRSDSLRQASQSRLFSVPERQAFGSLPRPDLRDQGHGSWEDWEIQYGMRSDSAREAPRHAVGGGSDAAAYQQQKQQLEQATSGERTAGGQLGYRQAPTVPAWEHVLAAQAGHQDPRYPQQQPQPSQQHFLQDQYDRAQLQQQQQNGQYGAALQQQYQPAPPQQQQELAPDLGFQQYRSSEDSPRRHM